MRTAPTGCNAGILDVSMLPDRDGGILSTASSRSRGLLRVGGSVPEGPDDYGTYTFGCRNNTNFNSDNYYTPSSEWKKQQFSRCKRDPDKPRQPASQPANRGDDNRGPIYTTLNGKHLFSLASQRRYGLGAVPLWVIESMAPQPPTFSGTPRNPIVPDSRDGR
ncbi:hypothetical protein NEUTE1DRAFT_134918 [Neurospora tetrasperma FGSC 2508]|uniref:Uncharacterized protein n=1 Tax=Neurospora tetrasperma (strain FGSC 2508 / ATCC MYA-4615 / P0657) TaxID=510951 RepID=F8MF77_NEUT8|nr:uncharacterized protein NEUTE1DRAFT_134918 [Neurospora tetrasperma FGSC 2508]EGO60931.1 hypothetical protein NEUTE1DRAFT_134918 [Neurospora tetrasperma FGSC 2508]EGZ75071.1 hypothetical protein NEUTE2DRAFT_163994 [Neurospora tetrasperma FGSC 2509]